ncbi:hypothetical protein GCM10027168_10000 [Streptomyces capparidis]
MADESEATPIHTRYAQQLADDLQRNRQQQAELQGRLEQLKVEEEWLSRMKDSLPAASPIAAEAGETGVPQPRQESSGRRASTAKRRAGQNPGRSKPAGDKAAAKRATGAKSRKTSATDGTSRTPTKTAAAADTTGRERAEPTLRQLVEDILSGHAGEPVMVSEVHAELEASHPERAKSGQVTRSTLEALAKKGRIEKSTQQGSVMYTKPKPKPDAAPRRESAAAGADEGAAGSGTAVTEAAGDEAGKVPTRI